MVIFAQKFAHNADNLYQIGHYNLIRYPSYSKYLTVV